MRDATWQANLRRPSVKMPFWITVIFNPKRSSDFGEIARLCHASCFRLSRRRSGLRQGVARSRIRTKAGEMPECLISPIGNRLGVPDDRFGFDQSKRMEQ